MTDPYGSYGDQNEPDRAPAQPAESSYYGQTPQAPVTSSPSPDQRPGVVTAAAVIAIVMSALSAVLFALMAIVLPNADVDPSDLQDVPGYEDVSADDLDMAMNAAAGVSAVLLVFSLVAIVLAILTLKRRNGARITLVVFSFLAAALCVLGFAAIFPLLWGVGAVAVAVMLLVRRSGDWFRR